MSENKSVSKQIRIYQPTYQLESRKSFNPEDVKKILQQHIDSELQEVEYNEKVIPDLCTSLAENIRTIIKEQAYDRYDFVLVVT